MKSYLLSVLLMVLLASCTPSPQQYYQQQAYAPMAQEGYDRGERVVYVRDNNGQQFLMSYLMYNQLMSNGGYNNVIHHYHSNPNAQGNRKVPKNFKRGRTMGDFSSSYNRNVQAKKVYQQRVEARKQAIYKRQEARNRTQSIAARSRARSLSRKPTSSSYSYSKPSRSTYKSSSSSYRSSSSRSSSSRRR